ncbi:MAG: VTT domain-containing protein [Planctomycetota bacterium]
MSDHNSTMPPSSSRPAAVWIKAGLAILVLLALGLLLWLFGSEFNRILVNLKAWIEEQGPMAGIAFILLFIIFSCLTVPDSIFCIAAGAIFGFLPGLGLVLIAATLSRIVQFALARGVLGGWVLRFISEKPRLLRMTEAVRADQLRLQFLIRLTPMSFALGSYIFGAIGVRFGTFMLALAGTLPLQLVMLYIGVEGAHVAEMGTQPSDGLGARDLLKITGLLVSIVVFTLVVRVALRELRLAAGEGADPTV